MSTFTTDDLWVTRRVEVRGGEPVTFPIKRKGDFERRYDDKSNTVGAGDFEAGTWGPKPDLVTEPLCYDDRYDLGGYDQGYYIPPKIYVRPLAETDEPRPRKRIAVEVLSVEQTDEGTFITYTEMTQPWAEYIARWRRMWQERRQRP